MSKHNSIIILPSCHSSISASSLTYPSPAPGGDLHPVHAGQGQGAGQEGQEGGRGAGGGETQLAVLLAQGHGHVISAAWGAEHLQEGRSGQWGRWRDCQDGVSEAEDVTLTVARSISGKSMGLMGRTSTDMGEFTTSDPPNEGTVRECSSNTSGEVEEEEVREDGPHPLSPADGEVAIRRSGGG